MSAGLRPVEHGPRMRNGTVLIIGDSKNPQGQRQFASQTPGATAVESVDLRDLVSFARSLDLKSKKALQQVVGFAEDVMTNVGGPGFLKRVETLQANRNPQARLSLEKYHYCKASLINQLFRECANCLVPLVSNRVSAAIGPEYFGAAFVHYKWLRVPRGQLFTMLLSALESNPVRLAARFHAGRLVRHPVVAKAGG